MKKVVLVHDGFEELGGGEIMLIRVAKILNGLGHIVDLKLFWGEGKALSESQRRWFNTVETVKLSPARVGLGSLKAMQQLLTMKTQWQIQNYQGVLAFSLRSAVRAAAIAGSMKLPMAWMCQQSLPLFAPPYQAAKQFVGLTLLKRAQTHIICIAEESYKAFQDMGFRASQLSLIRNGIDRTFFSQTKALRKKSATVRRMNLANFDLRVAMVARLDPIKGHRDLIEAVAKNRDKGINVFALCIGGSSPHAPQYKKQLVEKIETEGLQRHFIWTGHKKDIRPYLSIAECLVLPSYKEAQGLVLAEGAAAGLGVIGRNVGGIPEFIKHQQTGLLFDGASYPGLEECLAYYAQSKTELSKHQKAAEQRVAQEYDSVAQNRRWQTVLRAWLTQGQLCKVA